MCVWVCRCVGVRLCVLNLFDYITSPISESISNSVFSLSLSLSCLKMANVLNKINCAKISFLWSSVLILKRLVIKDFGLIDRETKETRQMFEINFILPKMLLIVFEEITGNLSILFYFSPLKLFNVP